MLTMTMDTRALEGKLHELAKAARVSPGLVMKEEAKFIVQGVMRLTPPATYAQGRKAVARDLGRVFTSLPAIMKRIDAMSFAGKEQFQAAMTRASRANDENAVRELLTRPIQGAESVTVRPYTRNGVAVAGYTHQRPFSGPMLPQITGGTQIGGTLNPNLHTARRNARGRVTGRHLSQVVTKAKELNDYRKQVQSRVGWAMAGWLALATATGAKVPAWVSKTRLESVSGRASVNFGERPFVRATNLDVKIPGYQRVVDTVVATRIRITERKIVALLRGRAVNLGFTRVAAR
jgi:hypothetical protein